MPNSQVLWPWATEITFSTTAGRAILESVPAGRNWRRRDARPPGARLCPKLLYGPQAHTHRFLQACVTRAITVIATCYGLKRLARFEEDGADVFYKILLSKTKLYPQGVGA